MFEKHALDAVRWSRALALMMAMALTTMLTGCTDARKGDTLTDPTVSARVGDSRDDDDADEADESDERDEQSGGRRYEQVEFLGNPLVSEVTIVKANHDRYNRTQPYNTAEFGAQSLAFINAFRGGQPAVANTLGAVLYPDMLIVESSRNPATSGWLSWALANGWGGRNLSDDVVDAGLSAIFGKVIASAGAFCDNGQLPLCTDNVPANDKAFLRRFPYLAAPTLP
jgi:Domain of unknown function (DUF4331)